MITNNITAIPATRAQSRANKQQSPSFGYIRIQSQKKDELDTVTTGTIYYDNTHQPARCFQVNTHENGYSGIYIYHPHIVNEGKNKSLKFDAGIKDVDKYLKELDTKTQYDPWDFTPPSTPA
jgi:hypothetical protein